MRRTNRGVDQTIFLEGAKGIIEMIKILYDWWLFLIRIHSYEYILVQCMHNTFVIEATEGCVWVLAGCGPL